MKQTESTKYSVNALFRQRASAGYELADDCKFKTLDRAMLGLLL